MTLPAELARTLPDDTANTWIRIAPIVPQAAYLAGGTGLAVHLHHPISEDLDFFFHGDLDLDRLHDALVDRGPFVASHLDAHTLNGVFGATKIQFLDANAGASPQHRLDVPTRVAGLNVAGMRDLVASKLKVVVDRSELRDYFDLMMIETSGSCTMELGMQYFAERYQPKVPDSALLSIVKSLGYFDDVDEDRLVPVPKTKIETYWRRRQPQLLRALSRR